MPQSLVDTRMVVARARAFAPLAVFMVAGACQSPTVRVDGLSLAQATPEASEYTLRLVVTNPTSTPFALEQWDYGGECDGRAFDPSHWMASRTLPAHTTATIELPLILPGPPAERHPWRASGTLTYSRRQKLSETIHDLGIPNPTESFVATGSSAGQATAPASALE
ncbi:MAG: hypothetical protein O2819_01160 [Planctomycetota bacterium]|nr:hypothetical protein [Planctomycetota bacterium]MDA1105609.1 hypothetical protein [Planctomycetota bacterium]